jgi:drug/metabolite transporter (DMT)-like permease
VTKNSSGILFGLAAVAGWSSYSIAGAAAIRQGYAPQELAALRYVVPAVALLPFAFGLRFERLRTVGVWKLLTLTLLVGPLYGFAIMYGLTLAPVSHAVVLGPAGVLLATQVIMFLQLRRLPQRNVVMGVLLVLVGVATVAQPRGGSGFETLIGDAAFLLSGIAFAVFGILSRRWSLQPVDALTGISVFSTLGLLPFLPVIFGATVASHDLGSIAFQVLMQGLVGGLFALLAYVAAAQRLGAMRASFFPAFVPVATISIAAALGVEQPTIWTIIGGLVATAGLIVSQRGEKPKTSEAAQ